MFIVSKGEDRLKTHTQTHRNHCLANTFNALQRIYKYFSYSYSIASCIDFRMNELIFCYLYLSIYFCFIIYFINLVLLWSFNIDTTIFDNLLLQFITIIIRSITYYVVRQMNLLSSLAPNILVPGHRKSKIYYTNILFKCTQNCTQY